MSVAFHERLLHSRIYSGCGCMWGTRMYSGCGVLGNEVDLVCWDIWWMWCTRIYSGGILSQIVAVSMIDRGCFLCQIVPSPTYLHLLLLVLVNQQINEQSTLMQGRRSVGRIPAGTSYGLRKQLVSDVILSNGRILLTVNSQSFSLQSTTN